MNSDVKFTPEMFSALLDRIKTLETELKKDQSFLPIPPIPYNGFVMKMQFHAILLRIPIMGS